MRDRISRLPAWRVASHGSDNVVGPADRWLLPLAAIGPVLSATGILVWSAVQTRAALRRADGAGLAGEVLVATGDGYRLLRT